MSSFVEAVQRRNQEAFERAKPHWERFEHYANRLGDTARAFSFAGIALVWLFRRNVGDYVVVPPDLVLAGIFFVSTLIAELLRIFFAALESLHFGNTAYLGSFANRLYRSVWNNLWRLRPSELLVVFEAASLTVGFWFVLRFLVMVVRSGT